MAAEGMYKLHGYMQIVFRRLRVCLPCCVVLKYVQISATPSDITDPTILNLIGLLVPDMIQCLLRSACAQTATNIESNMQYWIVLDHHDGLA